MGYAEYKNTISIFNNVSDTKLFDSYYDSLFFKKVGSRIMLLAIVVIGIVVINIVKLYNNMVSLRAKIENALSSIDVYLKQRFDLIPNLVQTVKAYSNYEKETIERIVKLRTEFNRDDKNVVDKSKLDDEYNILIAKVEAYPELKANANFLELQKQLVKMENQIQADRKTYNMQATEYNIIY